MRWKYWLIVAAALFLPTSVEMFGQAPKSQPHATRILRNRDILQMVRGGIQSHLIIATIITLPCNFDVFPPILDDLRRRGVPDNVLHFMSVVPPNLPEADQASPETLVKRVRMPRGLVVMVETLYPVSSADFKLNNTVPFSVVRPVFIDGVLAIPRGTIARAKIVRVKKEKSFGRGGTLTLKMEHILAVDGTRVPVQVTAAGEDGNRSRVVAVGVSATTALIFPYTAPAAIVWGFRKGTTPCDPCLHVQRAAQPKHAD